jgi:hypothetical protein
MDGLPKFANVGNERPRLREATFEIGPNGMAVDLLRAVYRNPSVDLSIRMRAAMACLPHEVPKLAVTAVVSEQDFATVLDRRLKRIEEMKLIEAKPTIDGVEGKPVDVRLPPVVPDRRFRRI